MPTPNLEDRGAEARREVERTVVGRGWARLLGVSFVLVISAAAPWRLLESALGTGAEAAFMRPIVDGAASASHRLATGHPLDANRQLREAMIAVEDELEEGSPLHRLLLARANELLSGWGGAPTPQVVPGRGGWLFLRSAVEHVTGPGFLGPRQGAARQGERLSRIGRIVQAEAEPAQAAPSSDPLESLLAFAAELSRRDILLLVLPVPSKVTIHPRRLSAFSSPEAMPRNEDLERFVAALEESGVVVLDPAPLLHRARRHGEQYLRTDSHWRPEAVRSVARALAESVSRLEAQGRLVLEAGGESDFEHGAPRTVANRGDLVRALGLEEGSRLYPAQRVEIAPVQEIGSGGARPWEPRAHAEILLLGDSFTNVYSQAELGWGTGAGLGEQLSLHLARPVDRIAVNAGGPRAVREALDRTRQAGVDRLNGKRLVIYEFASRELSSGAWSEPPPAQAQRRAR